MRQLSNLLFCSLLLTASQAAANRPGLEGRSEQMSASPQSTQQQAPRVIQRTGDVIEIEQGETVDVKVLDFPRRGMSMRTVLNKLGKPKKTPPAVGNPPIRLWIYDDRTVYFENMTVIHVVAKP